MKVLLHVCCAPCSTYPLRRLRELGHDVTGLWYNPNIHPFQEHEARRLCFGRYAETAGLPVLWWPRYEMPAFMRRICGHEGERCADCYRMRLIAAADAAQSKGFEAFSTTLLISPYQKHDMIAEIGVEIAAERGLQFYYEDFRSGWTERGRAVKELNLYRQQYCGCLYSEYERYRDNELAVSQLEII
jgi:epoxyqueuosine reductase